ncbi:nucleotidyltransferase family protein [Variovorax sp. RHLX14]|uniref:nucleotidyltransferase family protein n=1 Tax=Variovorax sp. RHLX14 TaxID=1259731 RepID=UPI003F4470CF
MLLAAGRGERMRPLTDSLPKPLLTVRGKPLMQWPMEALAAGGFGSFVVNTAWLGERIVEHFGNEADLGSPGSPLPVRIAYSHEGRDFGGALETAGGIVRALPLLDDIFWVVAGDVYAPDFRFTQAAVDRFATSDKLAHLWLVPNPAHNPRGDFGLSADGLAHNDAVKGHERLTFSTIALYRAAFFAPPNCDIDPGNPAGVAAPLAPMLRAAMKKAQVSAERYLGSWTDVGTPARLTALNETA